MGMTQRIKMNVPKMKCLVGVKRLDKLDFFRQWRVESIEEY